MHGRTDGEGEPLYVMAPTESEPAEVERKSHESGNVFTFLVDSWASGHYVDDLNIPELKHRLHDYTSLSTPRTILTAGGHLLDRTAEGVLQGLITDDYREQHVARILFLIVSGVGRKRFSVKQQRERAVFRFSVSTNPGWRRVILPSHLAKRTTISTPSG